MTSEKTLDEVVELISMIRHGAMDEKQFEATVKLNIQQLLK